MISCKCGLGTWWSNSLVLISCHFVSLDYLGLKDESVMYWESIRYMKERWLFYKKASMLKKVISTFFTYRHCWNCCFEGQVVCSFFTRHVNFKFRLQFHNSGKCFIVEKICKLWNHYMVRTRGNSIQLRMLEPDFHWFIFFNSNTTKYEIFMTNPRLTY